jgi:hypothetical protein
MYKINKDFPTAAARHDVTALWFLISIAKDHPDQDLHDIVYSDISVHVYTYRHRFHTMVKSSVYHPVFREV